MMEEEDLEIMALALALWDAPGNEAEAAPLL
jgi:hypothetical protein